MTRSERREILTAKLVDAAAARIARDGLGALRARDLAKDAGIALGSIYNVFADMDDLILKVNGRTFREMGAHIRTRLEDVPASQSEERIVTMALAYLDYAEAHPRLWQALFETPLTSDDSVPDWYLGQIAELFEIISAPLRDLRRDLDEEEIGLLTRGLFSSVHGIVLLNVQHRVSAVPTGDVRRVIELLLRSALQVPQR